MSKIPSVDAMRRYEYTDVSFVIMEDGAHPRWCSILINVNNVSRSTPLVHAVRSGTEDIDQMFDVPFWGAASR